MEQNFELNKNDDLVIYKLHYEFGMHHLMINVSEQVFKDVLLHLSKEFKIETKKKLLSPSDDYFVFYYLKDYTDNYFEIGSANHLVTHEISPDERIESRIPFLYDDDYGFND